jgi:hypothetical protein
MSVSASPLLPPAGKPRAGAAGTHRAALPNVERIRPIEVMGASVIPEVATLSGATVGSGSPTASH